ncbi:hypothetical protein [uncultured Cetobacterium sp.]|uniref:hypothetical protein n=1 Tax=uncultured Cetobacterium sp. TaxID=527638 RepID=UPI002604D5C2|nr:hypothetical protein [uncultured Cetobacterium sp.]
MWPDFVKKHEDGMPKNAMWLQCIVVVVFVGLISFGGEGAAQFFSKLILMTNVAMTIPYIFVAGAFPAFKNKSEIEKPFEIYKGKTIVKVATVFTVLSVSFANITTILSPYLTTGDISSTIWMVAGPVVFTIAALVIYSKYEKKYVEILKTQKN